MILITIYLCNSLIDLALATELSPRRENQDPNTEEKRASLASNLASEFLKSGGSPRVAKLISNTPPSQRPLRRTKKESSEIIKTKHEIFNETENFFESIIQKWPLNILSAEHDIDTLLIKAEKSFNFSTAKNLWADMNWVNFYNPISISQVDKSISDIDATITFDLLKDPLKVQENPLKVQLLIHETNLNSWATVCWTDSTKFNWICYIIHSKDNVWFYTIAAQFNFNYYKNTVDYHQLEKFFKSFANEKVNSISESTDKAEAEAEPEVELASKSTKSTKKKGKLVRHLSSFFSPLNKKDQITH